MDKVGMETYVAEIWKEIQKRELGIEAVLHVVLVIVDFLWVHPEYYVVVVVVVVVAVVVVADVVVDMTYMSNRVQWSWVCYALDLPQL